MKKVLSSIALLLIIIIIGAGIALTYHKGYWPKLTGLSPLVDKTYNNSASRYTIKYPEEWQYDTSMPATVVFSGKEGSDAFFSTVNIQTVLTKQTGGQYENVTDFMTDVKNQAIKELTRVSFLDSGPYSTKDVKGTDLKGEYLIFTYEYNGIDLKQWQIIIPRNDNQVFYAWAYTAPTYQYDDQLPIAKAMLNSWKIY